MKLNQIKVDVSKIDAGAWMKVRVIGNDNQFHDLHMRLRGIESVNFSRKRAELLGKLKPEELDDPRITDPLEGAAMAEGLILDWDLEDDKGKVIPFNKKLATELLSDPGSFRLVNAIRMASFNVMTEGKESLEAARKN